MCLMHSQTQGAISAIARHSANDLSSGSQPLSGFEPVVCRQPDQGGATQQDATQVQPACDAAQ